MDSSVVHPGWDECDFAVPHVLLGSGSSGPVAEWVKLVREDVCLLCAAAVSLILDDVTRRIELVTVPQIQLAPGVMNNVRAIRSVRISSELGGRRVIPEHSF